MTKEEMLIIYKERLEQFNGNYSKAIRSVNVSFGKHLNELTSFLDGNPKISPSERLYCLLNNIDSPDKIPKCIICGKNASFFNIERGYGDVCSLRCSGKRNVQKEIEKYGTYKFATKEFVKKSKETMLNKYGVDHNLKVKEFYDKQRETMMERYGVYNISESDEIKEKKKETCRNNFGVDHPMQSIEVRNKSIETIKEKYGEHITNISQVSNIRNKIDTPDKNPFLDKSFQRKLPPYWLGRTDNKYLNPAQIPEIKEKVRNTFYSRYGVNSVSEITDIKEKLRYVSQRRHFVSLLKSRYCSSEVTPQFTTNDFSGIDYNYIWKCNKCNNEFLHDAKSLPICECCYPNGFHTSRTHSLLEGEVIEFCKTITNNIETQNRKILKGKEIDILLPDHKLGIEFDGLYWHSELGGHKPPDYHYNKTELARSNGLNLIHIFEDEWIKNKDIVKSIIKSKLGKIEIKLDARKCKLEEISDTNLVSEFLEDNHIQGSAKYKFCFGLKYNDEVVSILTIVKSRYNKNYKYEISRFCNKLGYSVRGGLSRLFKYFIITKNVESIITYVDLRYGLGQSYEKCGMKYINTSTPNYWYIKGGYNRESRIKYQKHKLKDILETFDPTLTEWQNMQLNGYDRIWDCGNRVYVWNREPDQHSVGQTINT